MNHRFKALIFHPLFALYSYINLKVLTNYILKIDSIHVRTDPLHFLSTYDGIPAIFLF